MYLMLILPLIAVTIAQISKFFVKKNNLKFTLKNISAYSGMPSAHSAFVCSLATITGLSQSFTSPLFAVTTVLALIVMRDAIGIRQYLGEHSNVINILVKDLKEDHLLDERYPKLLEKIGHTPGEVVIGAILGIVISLVGFYII